MYTLYITNKNYSSWSLRPWVLMRTLGIAFEERLVPLPDFLTQELVTMEVAREQVCEAFRMTGYFLERDIFGPRGLTMPDARASFIACL
jgi:hypothetical protein